MSNVVFPSVSNKIGLRYMDLSIHAVTQLVVILKILTNLGIV
jgi:hypothetical protein